MAPQPGEGGAVQPAKNDLETGGAGEGQGAVAESAASKAVETKAPSPSTRQWFKWAIGGAAVTAVVVGVTLGVTLSRRDEDRGGDAKGLSGPVAEDETTTTTTTTIGPVTTTTTTEKPKEETLPAAIGVGDLTKTEFITSTNEDVLGFKIKTFSKRAADLYDTCRELREDLLNAAAYLVNAQILQEAQWVGQDDHWYMGGVDEDMDDSAMPARESEMASPSAPQDGGFQPATAPQSDKAEESGETDYGTNNQVKNVDEADVTKSDGTNIYAAYGDKIVAFNARSGTQYAEVKMPEPWYDPEPCEYPPPRPGPEPMPEPVPAEVESAQDIDVTTASSSSLAAATTIVATKKSMPYYPGCWKPKAYIQKLLLHEDRLVAFVSGYGERDWVFPVTLMQEDVQATDAEPPKPTPILNEYGNVQMFVFNTTSLIPHEKEGRLPKMELLARRDLPGRLSDARSVGSIGHVVTLTGIDTYTHLRRYFYRYHSDYAEVKEKDEFISKAKEIAPTRISAFVDGLINELKLRHGDGCTSIARLAAFQVGDLAGEARVNHWWDNGIFGALATVSTFNITGNMEIVDVSTETKYAACFMPNSWETTLYATRNKLFLAGRGHDTIEEEPGFIDSTLIYGYHLAEGKVEAAVPFGVTKADGNILNQFSLDFHEGTETLRVAASVPEWNGCLVERDDWGGCSKWGVVREIKNTVSIFNLTSDENPGVMPKWAESKHLGEPRERVMAVRFIGNFGYVVTFRQTDPFYVLSLEDPSMPEVKGELKISGFSSYLHPTGDNETIVAVGHNATETGRRKGLMITLFDVKNASDPVDLQRYEIQDKGSTSAVSFDHKAFRYLQGSKTLILPARARDKNGVFKGFYIFKVTKEDIELLGTVNLAPGFSAFPKCTYDACLEKRSMVFDSQAVLMHGHYATSRKISEPSDENWTLDLDQNLTREECVWDYDCW